MGIKLRPLPKFQFLTDAGELGNGYKVNAYEPGTTTRKDTYTDYTGSTANANPVVLNARGEANIWFNGIYKLVITDADDVEVYTVDNYGEGEDATLTGNYVKNKNGGFETDSAGDGLPDNWSITEYDATSIVIIDTADQIEGLNSLKFVSTGLGAGFADSDFFSVQEGQEEAIAFAIKSSVVDVRNVVDMLWYTAAQASISSTNIYDDSATNPLAWTGKVGSATPPANARFAKIRIIGCHSSDVTPGSTWFDDVRVISGATETIQGAARRATAAEAALTVETLAYLTPATFGEKKATQAEVDAGTNDVKFITPLLLENSDQTLGLWELLQENVISADTSSDFENLIDDTYDDYMVRFENIVPANDGDNLWMRIGTGATPTWVDTGNFYGYHTSVRLHNTSAYGSLFVQSGNEMKLSGAIGNDGTAGESFSGLANIYLPSNAAQDKHFTWEGNHQNIASIGNACQGGGNYNAITAITSLRFLCSTGNITSGKIRLYGLKK